jgi:protein-disulfide isomerase
MAWNNGVLITPTFNIDGTILSDYDETKLKEILKDRL